MTTSTHSIFRSISLFLTIYKNQQSIAVDCEVWPQNAADDTAMTNQEAKDLTSKINFLRTLGVPSASNMNCLEWNSTLAQEAMKYAKSCSTNSIDKALNIAFKMTTIQGFHVVLEDYWFAELYRIESKTCDSGEPRNCKNWKALMNANNDFVGCSQAPCSGNQHFYVCVFDSIPHGESFVPYEVGKSCSKCPYPKTVCLDKSSSAAAGTTETGNPQAQSGETTQESCMFDWQCKWNEKCLATNKCRVDGKTNHQENVRCYLDSHCNSQYVCDQNTGTCNFRGRMFEHTTDKQGEKGACTDTVECPVGYRCDLDRYTCYKTSPRMGNANDESRLSVCRSLSASQCTFDYHCRHNEICTDAKCEPRSDDSERHLKFVTCVYSYHCPSEYVCASGTYTCYYAGPTHAHLPYGVLKNGAQIYCYVDEDCPTNYYCMKYSFTCYEKLDVIRMRLAKRLSFV